MTDLERAILEASQQPGVRDVPGAVPLTTLNRLADLETRLTAAEAEIAALKQQVGAIGARTAHLKRVGGGRP